MLRLERIWIDLNLWIRIRIGTDPDPEARILTNINNEILLIRRTVLHHRLSGSENVDADMVPIQISVLSDSRDLAKLFSVTRTAISIAFSADPDPAIYLNADLDLGSQTNADSNPGQT